MKSTCHFEQISIWLWCTVHTTSKLKKKVSTLLPLIYKKILVSLRVANICSTLHKIPRSLTIQSNIVKNVIFVRRIVCNLTRFVWILCTSFFVIAFTVFVFNLLPLLTCSSCSQTNRTCRWTLSVAISGFHCSNELSGIASMAPLYPWNGSSYLLSLFKWEKAAKFPPRKSLLCVQFL